MAVLRPESKPTTSKVITNKSHNQQIAPVTNANFQSIARITMDGLLLLALAIFVSLFYVQYLGETYLVKQLHLMQFNDHQRELSMTYYHRYCDESAQTTDDTIDLIVNDSMTTSEAYNTFMTHGVSVLPKLLSEHTAKALRSYILEENERIGKLLYVIENDHRWSFPIQVDQDPIIGVALSELLSRPHLVDLLEAVAGPNPAVIEFTAITAEYGAKEQYWHQDVTSEGSSMKFGRNFVPSYSLFVPLQNTTSGMGATGICPGSHMCPEGTDDFCPESAFQASGSVNNWELGAGALVSQQTTHRGEAFTDPNGEKRVLFILTFAPRPRTGPKTLETRMIGVSGSYSLHWSQWGHTLYDFQNPNQYMLQPWRTMRSLGLYKPPGRQWGWDYVTTTSGRIIHSEYGYGPDEFYEFIEKGGFSWLPRQLHGTYDSDEEEGIVWLHFFQNTVTKCLEASKMLYGAVSIIYLISVLVVSVVRRRQKSAASLMVSCLVHAALIHCLILGTAWYIVQNIEASSWAKNIRRGASFHVDMNHRALAPALPAVLPIEDDIMILEDLQSGYLFSNTNVLDYTHPGNVEWVQLVNHYGPGYNSLAPNLQRAVCNKLLVDVGNESRRILIQNDRSNWAQVSEPYSLWYCHRTLSARSNVPLNAAVTITDHLRSEVRFGYWRHTEMHRKHASKFVTDLQDRLIKAPRRFPSVATGTSQSAEKRTVLSALREKWPRREFELRKRSCVPPQPVREEPWIGAWLKEGDIVEAMYDNDPSEWYRGRLARASAHRMDWDVVYDDGDYQTGVCIDCVRPFAPYQVDETIDMRFSEDLFAPVKVLKVTRDTVDVKLIGSDRVYSNVESYDLRRVTGTSYDPIAVTVDIDINSMHIPSF